MKTKEQQKKDDNAGMQLSADIMLLASDCTEAGSDLSVVLSGITNALIMTISCATDRPYDYLDATIRIITSGVTRKHLETLIAKQRKPT